MRIAINLASRPFADTAPAIKNLRVAMVALAFAALILAIGLHAVHDKAEAARTVEHSLDGKIAQVRQEQQKYQTKPRAQLSIRSTERSPRFVRSSRNIRP